MMTDSKPLASCNDKSYENDGVVVRRATKEKMRTNSRDNSSNCKRIKHSSECGSDDSKSSLPRKPLELETDPAVLQRRQKQIDYGKNTVGYYNYTMNVPSDERSVDHPKTPDKYAKYSRRSWDTLIKLWRKKLHKYDTTGENHSDDEPDEEQ